MKILKHLGLISAAVLTLGTAAAQAQPANVAPDPFDFPQLSGRKPFLRAWWLLQQRAFPLSDIPKDALPRAHRQINEARRNRPATQATLAVGTNWVNIGPAPITGGQIGATGNTRPMSGRIADIAVDPANPNRWFVGGAQGGVWETTNAGANWTPRTDGQVSLATGAIAIAPTDSNTIYVGTGEAVFSGDAYAGGGLLKSTDGGTSWQLLGTSIFNRTTFSDIKVSPTDSNFVVAATSRGIAGRGAVTSSPPESATGIYRSVDGGATWTQKLPGRATDIEVDPLAYKIQYVGIGEIFGSTLNGVYRTRNAGDTWTRLVGPWDSLTGGIGRVELAMAPSNSNVLYVSIQDAINNIGTDSGLLGLWRTSNARAPVPTWTRIATGATDNGTGTFGYCGWNRAFNSAQPQCWYSHELKVDPANPDILYAGGVELYQYNGTTWTEVSLTSSSPQNGIHVDQHALEWAGNRLLSSNDGGIWSTTDGGATWSDLNTNLSLTQFYDGSIHPTDPAFALGGAQDNGTMKWTGGAAWPWIAGGDGTDNAISATRPSTDWAVSSQGLNIQRTLNGGLTFSSAISGINRTNAPFISRFEKCQANDNVFIAGTDNLWRSNNFFGVTAPTWSSNGPELASGITALAFAPSDATCNTYAVGTANGQLQLTANGGVTWTVIDAANAVPNRNVTDLAFDPTNADVLYVTLSGFDAGTPGQPGHLFKSVNALATAPGWANVSPPVDLPHNTVAVDPGTPANVFVGTDLGVWYSTDGGTAWTRFEPESGLPNVAVFELQMARNVVASTATTRLAAFTHGRGTFVLTSSEPAGPTSRAAR